MQLWPAIDIINQKPVRLFKGDYTQKTEYDESFSSLSATFSSFAHGIHVVDLDGAKAGKPVNIHAIEEICRNSTIPVEVGGGIRTLEDISLLLEKGVYRVILGTSAVNDQEFLRAALEKFSAEKIVVGVDAKDGFVATHGWEEKSSLQSAIFISLLEEKFGVKTVIFTDIATDGTLSGPPVQTFESLTKKFPNLDIIASGGVACVEDFSGLEKARVKGAIFGKAFYEGRISVLDLQKYREK